MRTVLITGTSSGIGLATALTAARKGWRVVATMRDLSRAGALLEAGLELDIRQLDVTDPGSINACFEGIEGLDALVNNAGISNFDPTLEMSTMDKLRANLEVNFFGVVAVSRAAMPLLRASRGRLVTIGSVHGVVGQPFNEAYCAAKFAVEGFMESLAPVAEAHGVRVSIVVPGFVPDTNFGVFPDVNRRTIEAASGPYAPTFAAYFGWVSSQGWEAAGQKAQEVAEVIVRTLDAEDPPLRVATNDWVSGYLGDKLRDRDGTAIQTLARKWIGAAP